MVQRGRILLVGLALLLVLSLCPAPVPVQALQASGPYGLWEERWVMPRPHQITNVIHDGSQYLAASQTGLFTSPDGRDWTLQPLPSSFALGRIALGLGRYFLVANEGLLTSPDAKQWQPQALGSGAVVREVVVGDDRVVLVGTVPASATPQEVVWVSADGQNWSRHAIAPRLLRIVYHQGRFVGMTEKELYRSVDGVAWSRAQMDQAPTQALKDLAAGNGLFVAVGENGTFLRSIDGGVSWTRESVSPAAHLRRVVFGDGRFLATGRRTASLAGADQPEARLRIGALFVSTDGRDWQLRSKSDQELPPPTAAEDSTEYRGTEEIEVLIAQPGRYLAVWEVPGERAGRLYRSADGLRWEPVAGEEPRTLVALAYGKGIYLAFDARGEMLTSADGFAWSRHPSPMSMGGRPPVIAAGPDGFVLAGEQGLYRSADGLSWTKQPVEGSFVTVVRASDRYLALTTDARAVISDGEGWKESRLPNKLRPRGIAYGAGHYVVVGEDGVMAASTDGRIWFYTKSGTDVTLNSILFANNRFVVAGGISREEADLARQETGTIVTVRSILLTSRDGKSWTKVKQEAESLRAVTFANGLYVAAGSHLLVSLDSSLWTVTGSAEEIPRTVAGPGGLLPPESVVYGDGEFVVLWGERLLVRRVVDIARSQITADRTSALVNGRDVVTFTVQLVDARGRPLPWRVVQLTGNKRLLGISAVTDGAGRAVLQVMGDRAGAVPYGVRVEEDGKVLTATVTVTWVASGP